MTTAMTTATKAGRKAGSPLTCNVGERWSVAWEQAPGDSYLVTGRTTDGRRFRLSCSTWAHASGVNLYNGRKYLVRDGARYLIQTVSN